MAQIEFGTFEPGQKQNPYDETITQLIEAGESAAVTLTVSADEEKRERLLFAKAANAQDKTARLRVRDDSDAEAIKLTFTLTKRHAARRGSKDEGAGE